MSRLARSVPGYSAFGPLEPGTVATDIVLNRYQIGAGTITDKHISPASITTSRIRVGAITPVLIEDGAITSAKIAVGSITGDRLTFHTVTADNLLVEYLSAISANMGELTAGSIAIGAGGATFSNDGGISGIFIGNNKINLTYGGVETVGLDGDTGQITASKFLLRTALSGARLQADATGIHVYDAAEVARAIMTASEGFTVVADDPATVTRPQQFTCLASGSDVEGSIYLTRATYTLTRTVEG